MNKSRKGITLIALVITIIVLLILAAISIAMLSGDNSILRRAKQATGYNYIGSAKDEVSLAYNSAYAEYLTNRYTEGKTEDDKDLTKVFAKELKKGVAANGGTSHNCKIIYNESGITTVTVEYTDDQGTKYTAIGTLNATVGKEEFTWGGVTTGAVTPGEDVNTGGEWTQDSEGKIVSPDGKVKLQIGDYVNYNALAGVDTTDTNNTTVKSKAADNGYGDQTFDLTKYTGDNKWRVLGVKNGKVELISADLVPLSDNSLYFYLKGRTGFQNAETELNKIAGLYGHGTHAVGARSVNVDDINKITGYNPNAEGIKNPTAEQIASGNKYGKNQLYEYGNQVTYSWDGTSDKPAYTLTNGAHGNLTSSHNKSSYGNKSYWFDLENNNWRESAFEPKREEEIIKLTSTDYYYYPETLTTSNNTSAITGIANNSPERDMLFNNTDSKYYWLASRCVYAGSDYACFNVRIVYDGYVDHFSLASSNGIGDTLSNGVRSVVSLASDIQLEPNGTNAWKFKQ